MGDYGIDCVIPALLSMPRISIRAQLAALPSIIAENTAKTIWRMYCAECLRIITTNTAKFAGGSYMQVKLADLLDKKAEDERTGEEIAADVIQNAGITIL